MEITLAEQTSCFFYSCLFGACMSLLYDLFRSVRIIFRFGKAATFFHDILYFFLVGVLTFGFILVVNHGELRAYLFLGEFLGWLLYHLTVGNVTIRFLCWLVSLFRRFCRMIWTRIIKPVFRPLRKLLRRGVKKPKKAKKNTKKDAQIRKKPLKQHS